MNIAGYLLLLALLGAAGSHRVQASSEEAKGAAVEKVCGSQQVANREIAALITAFNTRWKTPHDEVNPLYSMQYVAPLLNLDYPGLEAVRVAVSHNQWDEASAALLDYFKGTRAKDFKVPSGVSGEVKKTADAALEHMFRGNKVYPPIFRGVEIDWFSKGKFEGETIHDAEWFFQYHRLTWWRALARTYAYSADERYFYEWRYELASYAENVLPITEETPYSIKRGMETDTRCRALADVFPYFIQSDHFDEKTLLYFLSSFHQQAEHLRTMYSETGNHLVAELSSVFENGIAFPEYKKSAEWIDEALDRLPQRLFEDLYADGMNKELVFSYHGMYIRLFGSFYHQAVKHGYAGRLPKEYMQRLYKACAVMIDQTFPDWTGSQFGDAWKGKPDNWVFRRWACVLFPEDESFKFMKTFGREGTPPSHTSLAYPVSGFYFLRSDWTTNAVYMAMKNGAPAYFHNQVDNGTFEFYAYGRNFMNDSGCYVYNSDDPETRQWRKWFRSSKVHQTVTLDNRDINRDPTFLRWKQMDSATVLSIGNKSYDDIRHCRTVVFIDEKYILLLDQVAGWGAGHLRAHFQFVPCDYAFAPEKLEAVTRFETGANLLVKCFPQSHAIAMEEEEGWISYKQKQKERRPAWSYRIDKKCDDGTVSFLTALIPVDGSAEATRIDAEMSEDEDMLILDLNIDGSKYSIAVERDEEIRYLNN